MNEQAIEAKKTAVRKAIDGLRPQLIDLAEKIHQNPETKFEEVKAAQWLFSAAADAGFKVEKPVGGLETAFRAAHAGSKDGPVVAFLAEYDALPKIGHACGHNLIGTASLGAALGLAKGIEEFPGTIQLIGTPGEEGGGGKVILAEAGVFDGVDAAMMFHPSGRTVLWKHALGPSQALDRVLRQILPRCRLTGEGNKRSGRHDPDLQRDQRVAPAYGEQRPRTRDHHRWGSGPQRSARSFGIALLCAGDG